MASYYTPQERHEMSAGTRTVTPVPPSALSQSALNPASKKPRDPAKAAATKPRVSSDNLVLPQVDLELDTQLRDAASEDASRLQRQAEAQSLHAIPIYKRAITLSADAVVLTIASPFFAIWWIVSTIKRLTPRN